MINLDYPIEIKLRGEIFSIELIELSPKEAMEVGRIFDKDENNLSDFEKVYNMIVLDSEQKEALKKVAVEAEVLPTVTYKLIENYISNKKNS